MIHFTETTVFDDHEIRERFVRSGGPGHKNINRDATAVELRLDIGRSALPLDVKERLIAMGGRHVTTGGVLVVVSRADASQAKNRDTARARLLTLLNRASVASKERRPTAISAATKHERLASKQRRSAVKRARAATEDL
jgi:ribosome-associated protein